MKRPRLSAIVHFSFGLLFLSFLMTAVMAAQQEVAPERFDKSWGQAQPQKAVSNRKNTKKSQARRARKAVPATAKPDSQRAANSQTGQPVGR
jgi:hypothetical protein